MMRSNLSQVEQEHHRQAFEIYLDAPPPRTYRVVAEKMGVSTRTVRHWAKIFDWRQRLVGREKESAARAPARELDSMYKERDQLRKSARLGFKRVVEGLAAGRDVSRFIADLDKVVRLITFLDGGSQGPDPHNVDDVLAFICAVPDEILQQVIDRGRHESVPMHKV